MPSISNPHALWALLGIPLVLLIHFLQRKAVRVPVPALFLLENTRRDKETGTRLEKLENSVPLWMQLLAVLVITWILADPKFPLAKSTQRIALVLDSSASMQVFKNKLIENLRKDLPGLKGFATNVEYTVLDVRPEQPRIYAGDDLEKLLEALKNWQPVTGEIDSANALRLARSLVSQQGAVLFITDAAREELPYDAVCYALGYAIENVGFTGVTIEKKDGKNFWQANVRNYSKNAASRKWQLLSNNSVIQEKSLELAADAIQNISGEFPAGTDRITIALSNDEFTLDDRLPVVLPQPKELSIAVAKEVKEEAAKIMQAVENSHLTNPAQMKDEPDLSFNSYNAVSVDAAVHHQVIMIHDDSVLAQNGKYLSGGIIATQHPLMDGINWQALMVKDIPSIVLKKSDTVLLQQGTRPLIVMREISNRKKYQLIFNFDPRLSNAETQPAYIVLLHRFIEMIRTEKVAYSRENIETAQKLNITLPEKITEVPVVVEDSNKKNIASYNRADAITAPDTPGFYQFRQGKEILLDAAASFADTREADFRHCSTKNDLSKIKTQAIQMHSKDDPYWRIWTIALLALALIAWAWRKK